MKSLKKLIANNRNVFLVIRCLIPLALLLVANDIFAQDGKFNFGLNPDIDGELEAGSKSLFATLATIMIWVSLGASMVFMLVEKLRPFVKYTVVVFAIAYFGGPIADGMSDRVNLDTGRTKGSVSPKSAP